MLGPNQDTGRAIKPKRKKNRNKEQRCRYEVSVLDWHVNVSFNDYAYFRSLDREEFKEHFYMAFEGRIISTMSKKCKIYMAAKVNIHSSDIWYNKHMLREYLHTIGNMEIQKADACLYKEDTIFLGVARPQNLRQFF